MENSRLNPAPPQFVPADSPPTASRKRGASQLPALRPRMPVAGLLWVYFCLLGLTSDRSHCRLKDCPVNPPCSTSCCPGSSFQGCIHVEVYKKIAFHLNERVFASIWESFLNALKAAERLKPCKNPAPNWKWCKSQSKEFTLEDWGSGWEVVFKPPTSQQLRNPGF